MTTKSEKFRKIAKKLVDTFTVGDFTIKRILTENYNTETGVVDRTFETTTVPGAKDDHITDSLGNKTYSTQTFTLIVAGLDLDTFVIDESCVIVTPENSEHEISEIETDQYDAAFFIKVYRTQWQA